MINQFNFISIFTTKLVKSLRQSKVVLCHRISFLKDEKCKKLNFKVTK
jgi:hypothetical protein